METYQRTIVKHGSIVVVRPKWMQAGQRRLKYRYSYNVVSGSLTFFTEKGRMVQDNSKVVTLLNQRFTENFANLVKN